MSDQQKQRNIRFLLNRLYESVIIDPKNIPESYFDNRREMARQLGHGTIQITDEMRRNAADIIIADQKSTLKTWVDYLAHQDNASYPSWAVYWALDGMLKLGTYDKEKKKFQKRDKGTVAPFADLNREALATSIDLIRKHAHKEPIENEEAKKIIGGANFGNVYSWVIEHVTSADADALSQIERIWKVYRKGEDPTPLVRSLEGKGTGWCTAAVSTALAQLQGGDFYVYYTKDSSGKFTSPRVAIRMQGASIAEIRGVGPNQNLDSMIAGSDVVERKLREFGPKGERYVRRSSDMKRLTSIEDLITKGKEPSKEDLRFLYEIDRPIEGFGYEQDPRIFGIINSRDKRKDLSFIFNCAPEQISLTQDEALRGNIVFHYGDLNLRGLTSAEGLTLPLSVGRIVYLPYLPSETRDELQRRYPNLRIE